MIDTAIFCDALIQQRVDFCAGVPDSLLRHFCAGISAKLPSRRHVVAANEGAAIALAAGHYLATGRPGLVYMQNSGLGNAVNPLVSLADPEVYGVPMVLLIGWRGEPGVKDEPQHAKQGAITPALCEALGMPYRMLPRDTQPAVQLVAATIEASLEANRPVALIVHADSFTEFPAATAASPYPLNREAAVIAIASVLPSNAVVVSTTGHISRELFEYRAAAGAGHERDFLTVGSMGHASQIALGIALAQPTRPIVCLDGDGAVLMHMGALAILGTSGANNLLHVVLNNGAHDSVGGQPTAGFKVDLVHVAKACGYRTASQPAGPKDIRTALGNLSWTSGPHFMEIRVAKGARKNLGRPTTRPVDNKKAFMEFLRSDESAGP